MEFLGKLSKNRLAQIMVLALIAASVVYQAQMGWSIHISENRGATAFLFSTTAFITLGAIVGVVAVLYQSLSEFFRKQENVTLRRIPETFTFAMLWVLVILPLGWVLLIGFAFGAGLIIAAIAGIYRVLSALPIFDIVQTLLLVIILFAISSLGERVSRLAANQNQSD